MDPRDASPSERLWTPWRMKYIGGSAREDGCIFCNRFAARDDSDSLIVWRGKHIFGIMNLFPYNTGHIMLVPNAHAADPADLDADTLGELGKRLPMFTTALRRVFGCDGFNIGLNIGAIAGAGVAEHLHQHVVPRWQGDANFMPIIARTMAIPELIPVTYGKIRSEIERDATGATQATLVLFDRAGDTVLTRHHSLPVVTLDEHAPVWKSLVEELPHGIVDAELAGWAGPRAAANPDPDGIAMAMIGTVAGTLADGWAMTPVNNETFGNNECARLGELREQLAPAT